MMIQMMLLVLSSFAFGAQTDQSSTKFEAEIPRMGSVGLDVQWAPIQFANYTFAPGAPTVRSGNALLLSLEWLPLRSFGQSFGKLGLGAGAGFFTQPNQEAGGNAQASLVALPLEAHFSYHFDYAENQLIVPFASAGTSLTLLRQTSSTGAAIPGTQSYQGWEYSFGGQLCLNRIDPHGARSLRRLLGVENTYILFSFNRSQPIFAAHAPDLSYTVYRLGFRVEI